MKDWVKILSIIIGILIISVIIFFLETNIKLRKLKCYQDNVTLVCE